MTITTKTGTITYKHTKSFYDKQYSKYIELYKQAESATAAKGYNMLSPKKSRNQFETAYQIYQETAAREGAYSKGILHEIVRDQTLGLKRNAAAAFARKTQKLAPGKRLTTEQVQHMGSKEIAELYNAELTQVYKDALASGLTSKSAKLWVSQTWFGSD